MILQNFEKKKCYKQRTCDKHLFQYKNKRIKNEKQTMHNKELKAEVE